MFVPLQIIQIKKKNGRAAGRCGWRPGCRAVWLATAPPTPCRYPGSSGPGSLAWVRVAAFSLLVAPADRGYFQRAAPEPTLCGRASAAVLIRAQVAHSQHIRVKLQPLHNELLGASRLGSGQGTGTSSQSQIQEVCSSQGLVLKISVKASIPRISIEPCDGTMC